MAIRTFIYPAPSVTTTNAANGTPGDPIPQEATLVGGEDSNGDLQPMRVGLDGTVEVHADALPLPSGAATAAKQDTGNTSVASIDTKTPALVSGRVPVDGSGVTQPISATSLPLPTGAATSALQTSGNASLTSIDSKVPANLTVTSTRLLVDGSGVTQPISAASLPLPSGAATETTLSAQSTLIGAVTESAPASDTASSGLNGRLQRIAQRLSSLIALFPTSLGQKTSANSLGVVLASDQSAIPVSQSGTWTVQPGNTANTTAWLVDQVKAASSSVSSVASSASSTSLLASNSARKNASFFNDSTAIAYLKLGATASTSSYTVQIASLGYYELPVDRIYTGAIDCIWASANGNMRITELS